MLTNGEHSIKAGGVAHWVRVTGASHPGVPVVLVHGGPGANAHPFEKIGDRLAQNMPVVLYDQRGCGRSAPPATAEGYTVAQLVQDLHDLRSALGLDMIVPWGASFGCIIAAEYAVTHPRHVSRLILHAPPIAGPLHPGALALQPAAIDALATSTTRALLRDQLASVDDPMQQVILAHQVLADDVVTRRRLAFHDAAAAARHASAPKPGYRLNQRMADDLLPAALRPDLVDDVAQLDVATLLIVGLWDGHVGVDTVRDLAVRMQRASLRLLHRSAHSPHEEEPDEYLAAITTFLGTRPPEGGDSSPPGEPLPTARMKVG